MIGSLSAWWSAWKYVAIAVILLGLSVWGNVHLYGSLRSAKAECRAKLIEQADRAVREEFARSVAASKRAAKIISDTKNETANKKRGAQENTNERQGRIEATPVTGGSVMPRGLPRLDPAVDEANAAAGLRMP